MPSWVARHPNLPTFGELPSASSRRSKQEVLVLPLTVVVLARMSIKNKISQSHLVLAHIQSVGNGNSGWQVQPIVLFKSTAVLEVLRGYHLGFGVPFGSNYDLFFLPQKLGSLEKKIQMSQLPEPPSTKGKLGLEISLSSL